MNSKLNRIKLPPLFRFLLFTVKHTNSMYHIKRLQGLNLFFIHAPPISPFSPHTSKAFTYFFETKFTFRLQFIFTRLSVHLECSWKWWTLGRWSNRRFLQDRYRVRFGNVLPLTLHFLIFGCCC